MAIGVVILAHEHLRRTRQVARALALSGVRVAIHVDAGADPEDFRDLERRLRRVRNIVFVPRIRCDWGRFSLVEAGLSGAQLLLAQWPEITHVVQISGACLPLRPIPELLQFLEARPGEDFVDSRPADAGWVQDGLSTERFTLYFPFSWKRQRWLFDRSVDIQRRLGIRRKVPDGIVPHIGSQWWCLSATTLRAILTDPRRAEFDAFFRRCWIPDESYIPTLAHLHGERVNRVSLTLSRFDHQGKPHIFYDDHALQLEQTDHFFARKVWHGADGLYRRFLKRERTALNRAVGSDLGLEVMFREARERRCKGRTGLLSTGRFPSRSHAPQVETARDYSVFIGFGQVYDRFERWLEMTTGVLAHGRVFQRHQVVFALGLEGVAPGNLAANPLIRDVVPEQFLANLVRNQPDRHQTMLFEYSDGQRMAEFFAADSHAHLFALRGAWVLDLYRRKAIEKPRLLQQAARLAAAERDFHDAVAAAGRSDVTLLSLFDMVHDQDRLLRFVQDRVSPNIDLRPTVELNLRDLSGIRGFVAELAAAGVDVSQLGRLPDCLPGEAPWPEPERVRATA